MGKSALSSPAPKKPFMHHSILGRTLRHSILLTAFVIVVTSSISFVVANSFLKQRIFAQISSVATAKEDMVERRLQTDRERTALLASRPEVRAFASDGETDPTTTLLQALLDEGVPVLGITLFNRDLAETGTAGMKIAAPSVLPHVTRLEPIVDVYGWQGHVVYAPIKDGGALAVRYEARSLLAPLLDAVALGESGEVMLARVEKNELVLLHHETGERTGRPLVLGSLDEQRANGEPLAEALDGKEGAHIGEDYEGRKVFVAYRSLPSLGWGLAVKVDTVDALQGVRTLAAILGIIGILLLGLAAAFALLLARQLTGPLRTLARGIQHIVPGHWFFERSIHTGDEVEALDHVIDDLTTRLRRTYEHLEEEVQARTKELKAQYLKDRTILDTIEHGVIMTDAQGIATEINPAVATLLGFTKEELLGQNMVTMLDIRQHRKSLTQENHPVLVCLQRKDAIRTDAEVRLALVRKDKTLMPVMLLVTPMIQGDHFLGTIIVFQDVTEERRLDYMKSEFISLASHQLRTPLSSLMWYTELLTTEEGSTLSDEQKSYVDEMKHASKRMVDLVDALLHASRLEGGSIQPNAQQVAIDQLVLDAAEDMKLQAKERKVAVTIDMPKKTTTITTDPMLLSIVLQNVFSNAVKYSKSGGEIHVGLLSKDDGVQLIVSDQGIGIPKEDLGRLFQKLFRAQNVLTIDTDGSGLGLYISRMIMTNIGGDIRISSQENKGTTVTITLPLEMKSTKKEA